MGAHMVRDMNRQPPVIRLEVEPDGGVQLLVEVSLVGTGATRAAGREFVPTSLLPRLREIESGPYDEAVRCTASALLAHHDGANQEEAARLASRTNGWLQNMVRLVERDGPDALITHRYSQSGGNLPRYPRHHPDPMATAPTAVWEEASPAAEAPLITRGSPRGRRATESLAPAEAVGRRRTSDAPTQRT